MKKYGILLLGLLLFFAGGCGTAPEERPGTERIIAHRGASGEAPEHSFAAYDLAISYGTRYIEQDVVLSKDGTLYVSHDLNAQRLTGVDRNYADMTDREIDALPAPEGNPILKLSAVFDRYGDTIHYVIELKGEDDRLPEAFSAIVEAYGYADRIIVQSNRVSVLEQLEKVFPHMPKLLLIGSQESFEEALNLSWVDILGADDILMNEKNCRLAHEAGKQFNVWTLNTEEELRRAIELGVDSYFTDYPELAFRLEEEYKLE